MNYIKSFDELNEAYLQASRQPLYHFTTSLPAILESDCLKMAKPSFALDSEIKSISVSRSSTYIGDYGKLYYRLVMNADKLLQAGYKAHPVDEVQIARKISGKSNVSGKVKITAKEIEKAKELGVGYIDALIASRKNLHKFNHLFRQPVNQLNLPKSYMDYADMTLEIEYEERIYKEIKPLGKFLEIIQFGSPEVLASFLKQKKQALLDYLVAYPHIRIEVYEDEKYWKKGKEITLEDIQTY